MSKMETASKILLLLIVLAFGHLPSFSQCPPASPGHHRVQKGENLYRISKKYKISVDQICTFNGIQQNELLTICQELAISPSTPANNPTPNSGNLPPKPRTDFKKQQGGSHRIKPGETIAGLAELYGYTEERFRNFNGLSPTEPAWPDLVLRTSNCQCTSPQQSDETPIYVETTPGEGAASIQPNNALRAYPTWEEAIAANDDPDFTDPGNAFGEDPFTGSKPTVYEKPVERKDVPTAYKKEVRKIVFPNSQDALKKDSIPALSPEVKRSESGEGAPTKTVLSPEEELIRQIKKQTQYDSKPPVSSSNKPGSSADESFMTMEESKMVKEINFMRSIPSNYVRFVEDYKKRVALGKAIGTVEACDELIAELKKTSPLSILSPIECLYNAAKKHGLEQLALGKGTVDHVGSDGAYPIDRIKRECPDLVYGGENLVSGYEEIRDAVILLLIDAGIENRGHRHTLLDPTWKYVACYKIGQVGKFPHYWVQNFGK